MCFSAHAIITESIKNGDLKGAVSAAGITTRVPNSVQTCFSCIGQCQLFNNQPPQSPEQADFEAALRYKFYPRSSKLPEYTQGWPGF